MTWLTLTDVIVLRHAQTQVQILETDHLSWLRKWIYNNLWPETFFQWHLQNKLSETPKAWALRPGYAVFDRQRTRPGNSHIKAWIGKTSTLRNPGWDVSPCLTLRWYIKKEKLIYSSSGRVRREPTLGGMEMFLVRGHCIWHNVPKDTRFSLFKQRNKFLWKKELLFVL